MIPLGSYFHISIASSSLRFTIWIILFVFIKRGLVISVQFYAIMIIANSEFILNNQMYIWTPLCTTKPTHTTPNNELSSPNCRHAVTIVSKKKYFVSQVIFKSPPDDFRPTHIWSLICAQVDQPTFPSFIFRPMHNWSNPHFDCSSHLQGHTTLPPKRKRFYTAEEVVQARDDLTLFCDIYNVFFMFLIVFLCWIQIRWVPACKVWAFLWIQGQRSISRSNMIFSRNEASNKCNTSFPYDFDWAIHFGNYFYYSRSSSRSKGQFQGQAR